MDNKILDGLQPKFRDKVEVMLAMLKGSGFQFHITEGFRKATTQRAYYAQGREKLEVVNEYRRIAGLGPITEVQNKATITKCDGDKVKSKHQFGLAIDIVPVVNGKLLWDTTSEKSQELWTQLGQVGMDAGLEWGGNWGKTSAKLGWDCPHFEWKEG